MRSLIPTLSLLLALVVPTAQAQDDLPILEQQPCMESSGFDVICGVLTVPEDRSQSGGATVRLPVLVFKSTSEDPASDPVVYLAGGPGGSSVRHATTWMPDYFADFLKDRDVILFDQRGTGYAQPSLDCPEVMETMLSSLEEDIGAEALEEHFREAMLACRARLVEEGIALEAYTSAESAADLDALRRELGYEAWNLYGISYGTRLALTAMRDTPEGIRSVILDSSYPPQADLYAELTTNIDRAFTMLFEDCAASEACDAAYPDLETVFYEVVDALNEKPMVVSVMDYNVVVTGDLLLELLFEQLYRTEAIPLLPAMIYAIREGAAQPLALPLYIYISQWEYINEGMYYAVQCGEEVIFSPEIAVDTAHIPEVLQTYYTIVNQSTYLLCAEWGAREAGALENQAVESEIPTLVLAGEYDPVTPPGWGAQVAETLENSYFFTVPGYGHGVTRDGDCPRQIGVDFLNDPTTAPDAACLADIGPPAFTVP